jgi:hypothetical protein
MSAQEIVSKAERAQGKKIPLTLTVSRGRSKTMLIKFSSISRISKKSIRGYEILRRKTIIIKIKDVISSNGSFC